MQEGDGLLGALLPDKRMFSFRMSMSYPLPQERVSAGRANLTQLMNVSLLLCTCMRWEVTQTQGNITL